VELTAFSLCLAICILQPDVIWRIKLDARDKSVQETFSAFFWFPARQSSVLMRGLMWSSEILPWIKTSPAGKEVIAAQREDSSRDRPQTIKSYLFRNRRWPVRSGASLLFNPLACFTTVMPKPFELTCIKTQRWYDSLFFTIRNQRDALTLRQFSTCQRLPAPRGHWIDLLDFPNSKCSRTNLFEPDHYDYHCVSQNQLRLTSSRRWTFLRRTLIEMSERLRGMRTLAVWEAEAAGITAHRSKRECTLQHSNR
jgi:hypothetical protein